MKNIFHSLLCLLLCCIGVSWAQPDSLSCPTSRLLVIGVVNELEGKDWQDWRIGFGVRTLITQAFFNSGKVTILEEKPEIKAQITEINRRIYLFGKEDTTITKGIEEAKDFGADYIAYGKIIYFGRPQTDVSVGVLHSKTIETIIRIEVTLQNLHTGKSISSKGMGKAETQANAMLFSIREDNVLFDETTVGIATRQAVEDAVDKLIKRMDKIQ